MAQRFVRAQVYKPIISSIHRSPFIPHHAQSTNSTATTATAPAPASVPTSTTTTTPSNFLLPTPPPQQPLFPSHPTVQAVHVESTSTFTSSHVEQDAPLLPLPAATSMTFQRQHVAVHRQHAHVQHQHQHQHVHHPHPHPHHLHHAHHHVHHAHAYHPRMTIRHSQPRRMIHVTSFPQQAYQTSQTHDSQQQPQQQPQQQQSQSPVQQQQSEQSSFQSQQQQSQPRSTSPSQFSSSTDRRPARSLTPPPTRRSTSVPRQRSDSYSGPSTSTSTSTFTSTVPSQISPPVLPIDPNDPRDQFYVSTSTDLIALCTVLDASPIIALDTEFLLFPTYRPNLQLIQVATDTCLAIIDIAALHGNLKQLSNVFNNKLIIVHSAQMDMQILYDVNQQEGVTPLVPPNVFDTQAAASFLGLGNPSYARLVETVLGITITKGETMTDWTRRPITSSQASYALSDVRYLHKLYTILSQRLVAMGRMEWFQQDMKQVSEPTQYAPIQPADAYKHLFIAKKLKSKSPELAAFKALAEWREIVSIQRNMSPSLILRHEVLWTLASNLPDSLGAMANLQGIKPPIISQWGRAILLTIQAAIKQDIEMMPTLTLSRDSPWYSDALYNMALAHVNGIATRWHIHPFRLMYNIKDLEIFASTSQPALQALYRASQPPHIPLPPLPTITPEHESWITNGPPSTPPTTPSTTPITPTKLELTPIPNLPQVEYDSEYKITGFEDGLTEQVKSEAMALAELPFLRGWRHRLIGHELLELATGHRSLTFDPTHHNINVVPK